MASPHYGRFKASQIKIYPSTNAEDGGQFNKEEFIAKLTKHATKVNHVVREEGDTNDYLEVVQSQGAESIMKVYLSTVGTCIIDGRIIFIEDLTNPRDAGVESSLLSGNTGICGLVLQYDASGHVIGDYTEDGITYCGGVNFFIADSESDLSGMNYIILGTITNRSGSSGIVQNPNKYIIYNLNNNEFNFPEELKLHRVVLEDTDRAKVIIDDNPEAGSGEAIGMTTMSKGGTISKYGQAGVSVSYSDGTIAELNSDRLAFGGFNGLSLIEEPLCETRIIPMTYSSEEEQTSLVGCPISIAQNQDKKIVGIRYSTGSNLYFGVKNRSGVVVSGVTTANVLIESGQVLNYGDKISPRHGISTGSPYYAIYDEDSDNIIAGLAIDSFDNSSENQVVISGLSAQDLGFKTLTLPDSTSKTAKYKKDDLGKIYFVGFTGSGSGDVTYTRYQSFDKNTDSLMSEGYNTTNPNFNVGSFANTTESSAQFMRLMCSSPNNEQTDSTIPSGSYYIILNGTSTGLASNGYGYYGLSNSDFSSRTQVPISSIESHFGVEIDTSVYDLAISKGKVSGNSRYALCCFLDIATIKTDKLKGNIGFDSNDECIIEIQVDPEDSTKFKVTYTPPTSTSTDVTVPVKILVNRVFK